MIDEVIAGGKVCKNRGGGGGGSLGALVFT